MTKEEIDHTTFYFCDLVSGNHQCPKQDLCKRYQLIKDNDFDDYKTRSSRLYNVCKKTNYSLFLKMDTEIKEVDNESV